MNERQKRFAAHVDMLRKRAATGDVMAKQELVRISQLAEKAARQMREQQVLGALALAQQVRAQREAQDEAERDALYTPDRFDIADATANLAVSADALDKKVAARHEEWQQLDGTAAFVRSNPPSVLTGILGNQGEVEPGGDLVDVANWVGEDAETTAVTITVAPTIGILPVPSPLWRPYCKVIWGTKGMSSEVEVDVGLGVQFTLAASSVRVLVGLDSNPTGSTTTPLTIMGMLSFGTVAPANRTLTRTRYLDAAANTPDPASFVRVPAFGKDLMIVRGGVGGTYPYTANMIDFNGNNIYDYVQAVNTFQSVPIPLAPDIYQVALTNDLPGTNTARLIFGLAL